MNSIVVYLGRSAGALMFPFNYVAGDMNTHWEKLVSKFGFPNKYREIMFQ